MVLVECHSLTFTVNFGKFYCYWRVNRIETLPSVRPSVLFGSILYSTLFVMLCCLTLILCFKNSVRIQAMGWANSVLLLAMRYEVITWAVFFGNLCLDPLIIDHPFRETCASFSLRISKSVITMISYQRKSGLSTMILTTTCKLTWQVSNYYNAWSPRR